MSEPRITADTVRLVREFVGVSQEEFAARVGVNRVTVARWETGERFPSDMHRFRIREIAMTMGFLATDDRVVASHLAPDQRRILLCALAEIGKPAIDRAQSPDGIAITEIWKLFERKYIAMVEGSSMVPLSLRYGRALVVVKALEALGYSAGVIQAYGRKTLRRHDASLRAVRKPS